MHCGMSVHTCHSVHMHDKCTKVYICVHISTDTSKECTCKNAVILKSKHDKNFFKEILIQIFLRSERIVFDLREFAKSLSILLKISLDLGSKPKLLRIALTVWGVKEMGSARDVEFTKRGVQ